MILFDIIESLSSWTFWTYQSSKEIMKSIEVVFTHFFQPDGFRAERLGDAMRVLGMNPTEEEDGHGCDFRGRLGWQIGLTFGVWITKTCISLSDVPVRLFCFSVSICNQVRKHLADLGGPQYIDERTFHHFIKDSGVGIGSMFGEVSRRVFVKVCLMLLPFPRFSDFNDLQRFVLLFFTASCSTTAPRRMNWSSISRKFRPDDDSTGPNFMCPCLLLDSI